MKRPFLLSTLLATLVAGSAFAHHGWSDYDADKPLELSGTVLASGYQNPHGWVELKTADKTWHVVLAPPARMDSRGLTKEAIASGASATVYGYPHRSKAGELRAERITVAGKAVELR